MSIEVIVFGLVLGAAYFGAVKTVIRTAKCDCEALLAGGDYVQIPDEWFAENVEVLHCSCGHAYVSREDYCPAVPEPIVTTAELKGASQ